MNMLEGCDFLIDSYPFGGHNRIVDAINCGRPIVCIEGTKPYNRTGAYYMKKIGMGELVVFPDGLKPVVTKLIEDEEYRESLSAEILKKEIPVETIGFKEIIDTLRDRAR